MDTHSALKKTPLHSTHVELGANMKPFGGFEMPVQYDSIVQEHRAVRQKAGIFDVSHMGEVMVRGPQAFEFVQQLVTNDVGTLYDGRAMYTVMCTPAGGIVDDLLVYRLAEDEYMLVINAANIEKDYAWMKSHNPADAALDNISEEVALMAVQGPEAIGIVQDMTDLPLDDIKFYHFLQPEAGAFLGCTQAIVSRTGYTGEPGLEIYCEPNEAEDVWQAILDAGADRGLVPAGLGARDTLRLEAGLSLYGNDITEDDNPYEAGLGWLVKLDAGDFVGRDALRQVKQEGPAKKLIGFVMEERGIPRHDQVLVDESEEEIGRVTSGSHSPMLEKGIGMGYVPNEEQYTSPDATVYVQSRGRSRKARVVKTPFYKS